MTYTTSDPITEMEKNSIRSSVIKEILPWIEENLFDDTIQVKAVSHRSGYSRWHFQRVFREQTGYNLATYIRVRRVARAAYSVAFTDKELKDVACENGFTSQQNFCRIFKKYFEKTPSRFRKECSGKTDVFNQMSEKVSSQYRGVFF